MMEQMKPSGVDWIGDIPVSWSINRLKFMLANEEDSLKVGPFGSSLSGTDYIPEGKWVFNQRVVLDNNFIDNDTCISDEKFQEMKSFSVYPGDILITTRGTIGKVAIVPQTAPQGILHPCIIKFRLNKKLLLPELLKLLFNETSYAQEQFAFMNNSTTIDVIYSYSLKDIILPLIPINEQKAIYAFLHKECAQIDSIAADLEKQIALLQQYKKSLITETVTKGLDKSVQMKDSGVEWIGEIPVGWELSRIKYLTDNHHPYPIGDGDHGMIKADDYLTEGIPYIRVLNLTWGSGLNLENLVFISKEMNSLIKNSELKPNDILIAKTGATIGKTAIVPDSLPVSNTTSHVGKITLANGHDAKYFYYVMTSSIVQKQIQDISAMQSTRPELGIEGLKNLILTVPPFDIQQHIARFLDDHCAKIDRVLHEKGKQLSVIKQHKKSLIYEYVTGKKRVKEVR